MNMKEFNEGFLALCEMTDKTPSKPYTKFYYEAVKHLDVKEWEKSIAHVIQTRKYTNMPMPAEILEHAQGNPEDTALIAIQRLETAMREVGAYDSVQFDDPVLTELVGGYDGGWPGLCQITYDDWKFEKPRLMKLYKALSSRGVPNNTLRLTGISEIQNGGRFLDWEPTVHLISDKIKPVMIEGKVVQAIEDKGEKVPMPEELKDSIEQLEKLYPGKVKEG